MKLYLGYLARRYRNCCTSVQARVFGFNSPHSNYSKAGLACLAMNFTASDPSSDRREILNFWRSLYRGATVSPWFLFSLLMCRDIYSII